MAPTQVVVQSGLRDWAVRHEILSTGLATGGAGSLAMMAIATLGAASQGLGPLHPALILGETLVGPQALGGVAAKVAFGLLVHLVASVGLGVVLAALLPRDFPAGSAIAVGVGYALLAYMFVLAPAAVPLANPGFASSMQPIGGTWVAALAVFGGVLGAGPAFRRWTTRGAPEPARPDLVGARAPARP